MLIPAKTGMIQTYTGTLHCYYWIIAPRYDELRIAHVTGNAIVAGMCDDTEGFLFGQQGKRWFVH